jgi:hypothetical protein
MESLFDQKTADGFVDRIYRLSPNTQAQWGKMNVSQMLAHCQVPLKMATGDMKVKGNAIIRFLFSRSAKRQLLNDPEFKRSLPTMSEAKIANPSQFEKERAELLKILRNFVEKGPKGITSEPHPFFGEMSISDWDTLQVKHLDHHLRQFGV